MNMLSRILVIAFLLTFSQISIAAGYSPWTIPTRIEWVSGGVLISGAFGDINSCGQTDVLFLNQAGGDIESYKIRVSMLIAGFTAQKEMRFYSIVCTSVPFHYSGNVVNAVHINGLFIRQ
ncbi:MAG: hypothetical protein AAF385_12355 [Pseudomonadota bacterium]